MKLSSFLGLGAIGLLVAVHFAVLVVAFRGDDLVKHFSSPREYCVEYEKEWEIVPDFSGGAIPVEVEKCVRSSTVVPEKNK